MGASFTQKALFVKQLTFLCICILMLVAACDSEEPTVVPTLLSLPSETPDATLIANQTETVVAVETIVRFTWTPTATLSLTPSVTPTITPSPTETSTRSPIEETEIAILSRRTDVAGTQTALAPPTATDTPSSTPPPSDTPLPSETPTLAPPLPDLPSPNRIIFSSNRAGSNDIWLMNLDGTNPEPLVLNVDSFETVASCNAEGTAFVFDSTQAGDREIYLGSFNGDEPRPLTDTEGENFHPIWSPDGENIAFVTTRDGDNDVWIMDNGGGNARPVGAEPGSDQMPQWSPDGQQLLYTSNRNGQFDIFLYDLETETTTQLTDTEEYDEFAPTLSYDFMNLAYIAPREPGVGFTGILWLDNMQDEPQPAISAEGRVDTPLWLDGTRLLLSADLGGVTHVLLVDLAAGTRAILTNVGPRNIWPRTCFIADEEELSAVLPTGVPPTPTLSATPPLISEFNAVLNPGVDWETQEIALTLDDLVPNATLAEAEVTREGQQVSFTWGEEEVFVLTVSLEVLDGALEVTPLGYTVDGLPRDVSEAQGLSFAIQEHILAASIEPGDYRLEDIVYEDDDRLILTFQTPPL